MAAANDGRKPAGVTWESWVDRQIAEGIRDGQFDNLPGLGKPLPGLSAVHDDDWWLKAKLRDERLSYLPPTLRIRKEAQEAREAVAAAHNELTVRRILDELNAKIRDINRLGAEGPPSSMMPLETEAIVAAWRAAWQSS